MNHKSINHNSADTEIACLSKRDIAMAAFDAYFAKEFDLNRQTRSSAHTPVLAPQAVTRLLLFALFAFIGVTWAGTSGDSDALASPLGASDSETDSNHPAKQNYSDKEIRAAILSDIDDTQSLAVDQFEVIVDQGLVTLYGTVDSLMEKRRASRVAKRTRYVDAVLNHMIVQPSGRPDHAIQEDVVKRLRINDSLERREIEVSLRGGEVTLAGTVDSLAEKRLAEIASAGVRGVLKVDNRLVVMPKPGRSGRELREEIQGLIVNSVYLDNVDIDVRVENKTVFLKGVVGSAAQRDALERAAEIWGVSEVNMEDVSIDPDLIDADTRPKRYAEVRDSSVVKAIRRVFNNDPVVFAYADAIESEAENGVVTLTGTVSRLHVKARAERLAMDVVGVSRVDNELTVEYDREKPSDIEIVELVQAALKRSPYLDRRDIRVHSQRSHVRLFGAVETPLEKEVAGWVASGIPGVIHVNNALAIESDWEPKPDEQIQKDLERKLKFALFDASNDISVQVEDGVAVLSGTVDTWRQWQMALELAMEAGARDPHNMLNVRFHPPHGASRIYVPE